MQNRIYTGSATTRAYVQSSSKFHLSVFTKKQISLLAMNPKRHSSFVFSDYTKKQIPLLAMNPKGCYSFVSSDSTK
ncbi:hypothetical protein GmHk_16G046800 [Glycine max]|nr:hypothetical protein GmHk_16G046800 [Glycine max]